MVPDRTEDCHICERIGWRDAGQAPLWDAILRTEHWDVVHSYNSELLGWIVLIPHRHIESLAGLNEAECQEMSTLIRQLSQALEQVTGCAKTYLMQFSEQAGHKHLHLHLVPRMADQPADRKGPRVIAYLGADEESRISDDRMNRFAAELKAAMRGL